MHQMIFVNLPVADTDRSREFFSKVGYTFDEQMCQAGTALGMELGPNIYAMLLGREFFDTFHNAKSADAGQHEVLTCLSAANRDEVDAVVERALEAGGTEVRKDENGDYMYGRSYADLDGHIWEIMWMDVEKATEAGAFG